MAAAASTRRITCLFHSVLNGGKSRHLAVGSCSAFTLVATASPFTPSTRPSLPSPLSTILLPPLLPIFSPLPPLLLFPSLFSPAAPSPEEEADDEEDIPLLLLLLLSVFPLLLFAFPLLLLLLLLLLTPRPARIASAAATSPFLSSSRAAAFARASAELSPRTKSVSTKSKNASRICVGVWSPKAVTTVLPPCLCWRTHSSLAVSKTWSVPPLLAMRIEKSLFPLLYSVSGNAR